MDLQQRSEPLSPPVMESKSDATVSRGWIVCPRIGVDSEPWIDRQLAGFDRVIPTVVCWADLKASELAPGSFEVRILPFTFQTVGILRRWTNRMRNAPSGNYFGSFGREKRELLRMAGESSPDFMLCHFGQTALRLLPIAKQADVPLIAHFHGLDLSSMLRSRWYLQSLLRHIHDFAEIIVVGSHQKKWMLDHGVFEERLHLIPCGVPTDQFKPVETPSSNSIRFIAVSRLVPWKGLDYSLQAFARVRAQIPTASFTIIGNGPDRERLEKMTADLSLEKLVRFTGSLPPSIVKKELENADVFLQHSLTHSTGWCEGFGVSICEAAAMRLPVVSTRSGGIPDQVVDGITGFLVAERDSEGMAEAMLRLAMDADLRARLGEAARARSIQYFDTEHQVRKLEAVLLKYSKF